MAAVPAGTGLVVGQNRASPKKLSKGEIEELHQKAGDPEEFIVERKLDMAKFQALKIHGHEIYQVALSVGFNNLQRKTIILMTAETSFKSDGHASMWIRWVDNLPVTLETGFEREVAVYQETPTDCVDAYMAVLSANTKKPMEGSKPSAQPSQASDSPFLPPAPPERGLQPARGLQPSRGL